MAKKAVEKDVFDEAMDFSADAGQGYENVGQEDLGIPFIKIIQSMSPERDKTESAYIPGAEEGMLFNSATKEILGGEGEPIRFIPCVYEKAWVEWKPRNSGGGIVRSHKTDDILKQCTRDEKGHDALPSGNLVTTTVYLLGLYLPPDGDAQRVLVSFTSTQLKKARQILSTMITQKLVAKDGKKYTPPMWSNVLHVSTTLEQNNDGKWYGYKLSIAERLADRDVAENAKELIAGNKQKLLAARTEEPEELEEI